MGSRTGGLRARLSGWLPAWAGGLAGAGSGVGDIPVRLSSRSYGGQRHIAVRETGFDQPLLWATVALICWGLVMVYSASIALPDNPRFANYAHTHFVVRHALSMAIGVIAALLAFQVPLKTWERAAPWLFAVALLLMVVVLVPFIGKGVNGARRWISLGVMNFQPSELGKLAVLFYAASYMVRKMEIKQNFWQAVWPMAVAVGVVGMLLLAQPDMGAFMVIVVIAMGILHIGRQAIALDQVFSGLVAQGVGLWFGFQAFINIGVNLGALPTKGLTLPFMSYGGSAILLNMIALAVVLRVDYENRQMMKGGRA
jgi:cell division protein FtsW